ncbi:MAG: GGDEF domain-containing protein [Thermoanaerobacteraceae bacterium]|nr:GGDEF domain-containing protein [Thermoanaerobacteraceae bacterium]
MKEKMYKYAPAILLLTELILCIITFLIDKCQNYNHGLVYIIFESIQVVICIVCGILIKRLYQQGQTDVLTGLHNRKYFNAKFSEVDTKRPISLFLIDIDNFKSINDTYGHIAGDQVLKQFAEILQNYTRKNDIIARWGGEEFAVILHQTDVKEAFKIAERIRAAVENNLFSYKNITCRITISIGIASKKEEMDIDIEQFIKIADAALYKAKEKKNFIVTVGED